MKKRIYTTLGYMPMFILGILVCIAAEAVFIRATIPAFTIPKTNEIFLWLLIDLFGLTGIGLMIGYTIQYSQWIDVDEKGISARNLIKKIHYKEWNQIREIREFWLPMSIRGGFVLKYFILVDERDDAVIKNGIMRKNSYIMIPCNKKTKPIIKEFYKKEIVKLEENS